ncbi:hypothetical protein MNB_SV-3-289 [hydrothermal vent metagenome]|uniref:Uncharacterized protein n=1 Tax=hydrothermal vent metagenome TaxID=652676 RepID=A0A1W1CT48_9ZZZZ
MSYASLIRNKIHTLDFNTEYSPSIFADIASTETIKKTLQRSTDIIAKTSTKKFYRRYLPSHSDMHPYAVFDDSEHTIFDPTAYTFNCFWQTSGRSKQSVSSVIRNYLATMNPKDVHTLCQNFGKGRVKSELIQKYKAMYAQGSVNIKGLEVTLKGRYDRNPAFLELMRMIDDC